MARLADTLVLLADGKAVATGPVGEILARADLRAFTGRYEASVILAARIVAHNAAAGVSILDHPAGRLSLPLVDAPVGSLVRLRIRARDVAIAMSNAAETFL